MLSQSFGMRRSQNSGFSRLHLILHDVLWEHILRNELFCQTIYQNGSSSTNKVVHGVEAQKTASLVKWSHARMYFNGLFITENQNFFMQLLTGKYIYQRETLNWNDCFEARTLASLGTHSLDVVRYAHRTVYHVPPPGAAEGHAQCPCPRCQRPCPCLPPPSPIFFHNSGEPYSALYRSNPLLP